MVVLCVNLLLFFQEEKRQHCIAILQYKQGVLHSAQEATRVPNSSLSVSFFVPDERNHVTAIMLLLKSARRLAQQHLIRERSRSGLSCSAAAGRVEPLATGRSHRLPAPLALLPSSSSHARWAGSTASSSSSSSSSSSRVGSDADAEDPDAYDPSAWRRVLKAFFLRTHPDMLHDLPADVQHVNAESYKVLNDFLDTAAGFVQSGRGGGGAASTGQGADIRPSSPLTAQASYSMKFYVKPPAAASDAVASSSYGAPPAPAAPPPIVHVTLAVPPRYRVVQSSNMGGIAPGSSAEMWHVLLRQCLQQLLGAVSQAGGDNNSSSNSTALPDWVLRPSPSRAGQQQQQRRRGGPLPFGRPMTRAEVAALMRKEMAQHGAYRRAQEQAEQAAEAAVLREFDLGGFPPEVQRFLLRNLVFESSWPSSTSSDGGGGGGGDQALKNWTARLAVGQREVVGPAAVRAVSRLAVALLRNKDELELRGSGGSGHRPGESKILGLGSRGMGLPRRRHGRGQQRDGPTVIVSSTAAAAAAAAAAHRGRSYNKQVGGGGGGGASGVSLERRAYADVTVVVGAEDFDEDAFVAAMVRAKERLGLFDGDDPDEGGGEDRY